MKTILNQKGSIALISILLVSAITLLIVVSMSEINISTSQQHLNSTSSKSNYYLSEACFEESLIRLENDAGFTGTSISFDTNSNCTITISGGATKTVDITTNFFDYTQNYQGTVTIEQNGQAINATLLNWSEI